MICAVIEVIVEVLVLSIYAVIFYRFYTKKRLMDTMDRRDKARSDLYLAQLRMQSAPNTPGLPRHGKHPYGPIPNYQSSAENGNMKQAQYAAPTPPSKPPAAFQLQAPPIRVQYATPKAGQDEFSPPAPAPSQGSNGHSRAAPGEQTYESIPVPGAYGSPINSNFPPGSRQ